MESSSSTSEQVFGPGWCDMLLEEPRSEALSAAACTVCFEAVVNSGAAGMVECYSLLPAPPLGILKVKRAFVQCWGGGGGKVWGYICTLCAGCGFWQVLWQAR